MRCAIRALWKFRTTSHTSSRKLGVANVWTERVAFLRLPGDVGAPSYVDCKLVFASWPVVLMLPLSLRACQLPEIGSKPANRHGFRKAAPTSLQEPQPSYANGRNGRGEVSDLFFRAGCCF